MERQARSRTFGWMNCTGFGFRSKVMTEDGRSQPSSSRRTRPSHRLRAARSAQFFQIIPTKMKRAISVRKTTVMMATVRNKSAADMGFMSCLASCEAPGVNHSGQKMFRFQTQTAQDASGAGIRGGLRPQSAGGQSEKNSVRAYVFGIALKHRHCSTQPALRICAGT